MANSKPLIERPLSPHLQIFRPIPTMMMSIAHRVTGAALYFGAIVLAWYLLAAASGPRAFSYAQWALGSPLGLIVLFGFTWALIHHAIGGIRHLIWDLGYGFGASEREWLAIATIVGSIVLTVLIWGFGYVVVGGVL